MSHTKDRTAPSAVLLLVCLPLLAGCAGAAPSTDDGPITIAVIPAPAVGGDSDDAELLAEDLLLEVVTQLSTEVAVDLCLVPGPLLATDDEAAREALVGALGSVAAPVYVALGPDDGPRQDLLDLLGESLAGHDGSAAYSGEPVRGLRPVVLTPSGAPPPGAEAGDMPSPGRGAEDDSEEADGPSLSIVVQGGAALQGGKSPAIVVASGPAVRLEAKDGTARLELPPLRQPPHVFAVLKLEGGELSVTLHSALDLPLPAAPRAVKLSR